MAPTSITYSGRVRDRISTFFRNWGTPYQRRDASDQDIRAERYDRLWDLAVGNAFTDKRRWSRYRRAHALYRQTRSVVDYAHIAVEFWASRVWAGSIPEDGLTLPDGAINAVPFAADTAPEAALAAAKVFSWTNFQSQMTMIPRYTSALGELLVEVIDDVDRGRIVWDIIWPGYVEDVTLDEADNVISYALKYIAQDPDGGPEYTYRKVVTPETISTFRNGLPFAFDEELGSSYENPYGFCAARWFRHYPMLGPRGEPAIYAVQAEMDEANSLLSHLLDKVHVNLEAPVVVTGNLAPNSVSRIAEMTKRGVTDELSDTAAGQEDWNVLEAPAGTEIKTVTVQSGETLLVLERLEKSIERKLPEVSFLAEIRAQHQTTGPGNQQMSGDVDFRYKSVCSTYDRNLSALLAMSIAIGGWRANNGDWDFTQADPDLGEESLSEEQQRFLPFDLHSYIHDEIDLVIMPRDLVPESPQDKFNLLISKQTAVKILNSKTGRRLLAIEAGYPASVVDEMTTEYEEALVQQQEQQQQAQLARQVQAGSKANPPGAPNRNGRPAAVVGSK